MQFDIRCELDEYEEQQNKVVADQQDSIRVPQLELLNLPYRIKEDQAMAEGQDYGQSSWLSNHNQT